MDGQTFEDIETHGRERWLGELQQEHIRYRLRQWLNRKHKIRLGVHHLDDAESRALGLICLIGRRGSLPWANA